MASSLYITQHVILLDRHELTHVIGETKDGILGTTESKCGIGRQAQQRETKNESTQDISRKTPNDEKPQVPTNTKPITIREVYKERTHTQVTT